MEKIIEKRLGKIADYLFTITDATIEPFKDKVVLSKEKLAYDIADDIRSEYQITVDNKSECKKRLIKK